ncbi:MAG: hypothetical protein ACTSPB_00555 [Candidatus Thorarchaeota archaeon]
MVKCQRTGCDKKAKYGVQHMEVFSIWSGLCEECALEHVTQMGGSLDDDAFVMPIRDCDWYPRRITNKQKLEAEAMLKEYKEGHKKGMVKE